MFGEEVDLDRLTGVIIIAASDVCMSSTMWVAGWKFLHSEPAFLPKNRFKDLLSG